MSEKTAHFRAFIMMLKTADKDNARLLKQGSPSLNPARRHHMADRAEAVDLNAQPQHLLLAHDGRAYPTVQRAAQVQADEIIGHDLAQFPAESTGGYAFY